MKTNEVLKAIRDRRSVRSYTDSQIPEEDLKLILEAATYAPNGMHLETWHFTAIQKQETLVELNRLVKKAFGKSDDKHLQERANNENYNFYYHAPTFIIVSNDSGHWWAGMDCAVALENIFLAAHSLGIGSCWINQLGSTCDDEEVRSFLTSLGIPENHKLYGCAALGYSNQPLKEKKVKEGTITIIK
ncbi:MAG: nitroreductase family protein [Bacteroides sp.]|nr:nitroreductase family protein [Bacteroides sp.]